MAATCTLRIATAVGHVEYQGFLGKFFLAKPRSSSGYALAADKKQLRIGAGIAHAHINGAHQQSVPCMSSADISSHICPPSIADHIHLHVTLAA